MTKRGPWSVLLAAGLTLAGCGRSQPTGCRPDAAANAPMPTVRVQRLEAAFFEIQGPGGAVAFMKAYPTFARFYLQRRTATDTTGASALARLAAEPHLRELAQQTAAAFPDSAALGRDLGALFGRVKYYFPGFQAPRAATFVSGFEGKDIFVNDSLLVLSLDWFAGPQAKFRPVEMPKYILRNYTPVNLMPSLALRVATKYNRHELTANTMLDAMVSGGKALYFAGRVLPCTSDSLLLGFTGKEMVGVTANEGKIWAHFLEQNLLYNTTPFTIQKYVGERPNVPEIDATCPGRVGQWVGLQIVRKYMDDHPSVTLAQLMAERNAQKLLNESHYRPKRQ